MPDPSASVGLRPGPRRPRNVEPSLGTGVADTEPSLA